MIFRYQEKILHHIEYHLVVRKGIESNEEICDYTKSFGQYLLPLLLLSANPVLWILELTLGILKKSTLAQANAIESENELRTKKRHKNKYLLFRNEFMIFDFLTDMILSLLLLVFCLQVYEDSLSIGSWSLGLFFLFLGLKSSLAYINKVYISDDGIKKLKKIALEKEMKKYDASTAFNNEHLIK